MRRFAVEPVAFVAIAEIAGATLLALRSDAPQPQQPLGVDIIHGQYIVLLVPAVALVLMALLAWRMPALAGDAVVGPSREP